MYIIYIIMYIYNISIFDKPHGSPLAQRASYLALHSSLG